MKQVTIVIPDGYANLASVTGAYQILNRANGYCQKRQNQPRLQVRIAGFVQELKLDDDFFIIHPMPIEDVKHTDLIIIPSVSHEYDRVVKENAMLINWVKDQYKAGAEVASICTGAFLVAAIGLLDGKMCSTHWNASTDFRRMFPEVNLQTDELLIAHKGIYTNGGAYSFLNLMLFLVEKYFDRETAIFCSKVFQIDMDRTSQSPFCIFQAQKNHNDSLIEKAQIYIEKNLSSRISFEQLASNLAVSRRNFDRRFIKATGNTPVEYLQRIKVEVAKSTLEKGRKSIFEVMTDVGYNDDKAFREVFKKITGLSPLDYRSKFATNFN